MKVLIFRRIFLYNVIFFLLAISLVLIATFRLILEERGNARVDLLQQLSEVNNGDRNTMIIVMEYVYRKVSSFYEEYPKQNISDEEINAVLEELQEQAASFGCDYTIDIILNNKKVYASYKHSEEWLKGMMQSYWYIKHFSGESESSWNLQINDMNDPANYSLCYAHTLYDMEERPIGVIILGASPSSLFRSYRKLLDAGSTIYILDERGIVISHSNPNMIGVWLYTIDAFQKQYKTDSYTLTKKAGKNLIVSNYRNPASGWIFVEEQPVKGFMLSYSRILLLMLLVLIPVSLFSILQSFWSTRKLSQPLIECANHMKGIGDEGFDMMPVKSQYFEIDVLSRGYNAMLERIRSLIERIKREENEKRRIEFAFLQAQINPHFLRNTMTSIKGLILIGQGEKAAKMLSSFMNMLNIPMKANSYGYSLRDETEYVRYYIQLMGYRYGRDLKYELSIEEGLEEFVIPPLILQPLVENAIFHGLSMLEEGEEGQIRISADKKGEAVVLSVEDNGGGMSAQCLEKIWESDRSRESVNSIGLKNVLSRIRYVFGEQSRIEIESRQGSGTSVKIIIDCQEKSDENSDCRR